MTHAVALRFRAVLAAAGFVCFMFAFAPVPAGAQASDLPTIDQLLEKAAERSEDINAWAADMETQVNLMGMPMTTTGHLLSKGDMQKSQMKMDIMGQPATMNMVVDKNKVAWMEMDMGFQTMYMKMDMSKTGGMPGGVGMPGMDMMGPGSSMGGNPLNMLKGFTQMYDLKVTGESQVGERNAYAIEGTIQDEYAGLIDQIDPSGQAAGAGFSMDNIKLFVDKETGFPLNMTYLNDQKQQVMSVSFKNVQFNPEVPDAEFEYTPPPGVQVMDMTEMLEQQMGGLGEVGGAIEAAPQPQVELNTKIKAGEMAPDFTAPTISGDQLKLSDYRGKVVLIDFWATWCGPCIHEMPNVIRTYEEYHPKGLEIIGVSLDKSSDEVRQFIQKNPGMKWPQVFDGKEWQNAVARQYGVNAIPFAVLLDRTGKIRYVSLRGDALGKAVAELLGEQPQGDK